MGVGFVGSFCLLRNIFVLGRLNNKQSIRQVEPSKWLSTIVCSCACASVCECACACIFWFPACEIAAPRENSRGSLAPCSDKLSILTPYLMYAEKSCQSNGSRLLQMCVPACMHVHPARCYGLLCVFICAEETVYIRVCVVGVTLHSTSLGVCTRAWTVQSPVLGRGNRLYITMCPTCP